MFEMIISAYRWIFLQMAAALGYGWAIVALSCICSALMAPLMRAVAGIVRRETDYQSVIDPQVAAIKARYASDMDRHLHIQRLYSRYGYSPLSPVKKVLPLFVQIPFLLLTYYMLKGTAELSGVRFLFLSDLGRPDALIPILQANLLPLVMTGVNIVTVFATPSFTKKDWTQAIAIALLFLVLLYTAPSALLLYWTLNNVITMLRTLAAKKGEGAVLLLRRIVSIRAAPLRIWNLMNASRLEWLSFGIILMSLYMWLMVYESVWFFNCYVSRFLMVPALLTGVAVLCLADLRRTGRFLGRNVLFLCGVILLQLFYIGIVVFMFLSPQLIQFATKYLDFSEIYLVLGGLFGFMRLVQFCRHRHFVSTLAAAIREEGHWMMIPVILALHYSFSSDLVKLPASSALILAVRLLIMSVLVALAAVFSYGVRLNPSRVFRVGMAFSVGVCLVPMISLESGKLLGYGSNLVVRLVFIGLICFASSRLNNRRFVTSALLLLLVLAFCNAVFVRTRIDVENEKRGEETRSPAEVSFKAAKPIRHNNVYLLVYDSYAHDVLLADVGISNSRIREILLPRGFDRYDAYSVGSDTVQSMGNSFAIGGVTQGSERSMMAGNNPFCDFLKRAGYRMSYALRAYDMPCMGECMPGDYYFPVPQEVTRLEDVLCACILRGYLSQSPNVFDSYTQDEWLSVKRRLIQEAAETNSFIYAHSIYPLHLVASEMYRKSEVEEIAEYAKRLVRADAEIEEDVREILSRDESAIIIVASDHGAYFRLCKRGDYGKLDLLDRCGIQLYIHWPKDYKPTLKLNCLTNVFLEVMIYLTGDASLARYESDGESLPIQAPLKAPRGAIKRGVVRMGRDQGKPLF